MLLKPRNLSASLVLHVLPRLTQSLSNVKVDRLINNLRGVARVALTTGVVAMGYGGSDVRFRIDSGVVKVFVTVGESH